MKRVLVALIAGAVLSGMAAAYASVRPAKAATPLRTDARQ